MKRDPSKINITKFGLCFYLVMVTCLFLGFAQSTLSPNSVLGVLTASNFGIFIWFALVISVAGVLELIFKKYGIKTFDYSA
ncbi:hypothetical protein CS022_24760 [Veronia nyctiphanis]|uniref:Uncharacterized protein n=1 Tax=Veronia nyctiphanis TaxID=1278244 RepID=A0A4Q0Y5W8_9GAMM|nr:hypothetical protein [Veronia nyctiphanis]RXJ65532.1 hypothetical protein CS022_24760 [Veronia nyctiphanis]